jgi:hypothetical protein
MQVPASDWRAVLCRCTQNLLTLQATCSFVFDYSTRRLLDLLSKATPAGGIPLGGTVNFQFCTLALGESQVSHLTSSDRAPSQCWKCMRALRWPRAGMLSITIL